MQTHELKSERIVARVAPATKAQIARAAALKGQSVTDFVLASAQREATEALRDHDFMRISQKAQIALAEQLLSPSTANPELKAAYTAYKAKNYPSEV